MWGRLLLRAELADTAETMTSATAVRANGKQLNLQQQIEKTQFAEAEDYLRELAAASGTSQRQVVPAVHVFQREQQF